MLVPYKGDVVDEYHLDKDASACKVEMSPLEKEPKTIDNRIRKGITEKTSKNCGCSIAEVG